MGKRTLPKVAASPKGKKGKIGIDINELSSCGSTSSARAEKSFSDGKVHAWVQHFCTNGCVYSERFAADRLDVIQFACKSDGENPLYMLKYRIAKFFTQATETGVEGLPVDFESFERDFGAQFVFVSKATVDKDQVGLVKNRICFYCGLKAQGMKNILMLIDDVWKFCLTFIDDRVNKLTCLPDIGVYTPPGYGLSIDKEKDECSCEFSVSESVEAGFSCFHLPPPVYPARFVVLTIQAIAKDKIHLIFGGNTKPFSLMFFKRATH